MHIVPAPAESLMKSRVLSIPGLQGVMDGLGMRAPSLTHLPHWDHDVFDGFNCSHFPLDWLNPQHIV